MTQTPRPGFALTAVTFLMLTVLIGLGTWQWAKIEPKKALIGQIEAGLSAEPAPLSSLNAADDLAYRRVTLRGKTVVTDTLRLFGTDLRGRSGYHLYGLLETAGGPRIVTSFGWVPFDYNSQFIPTDAVQDFEGVLLPAGARGSFTPENNGSDGIWYWADLEAMAAALAGPGETYPYRLILQGGSEAMPKRGQVRVNIPNDHFEYALTWYGLAIALLGVYGLFGLRRRD